MKKLRFLLAILTIPTGAFALPPHAPTLLQPEAIGSRQIRWHFKNTDKTAVAFELWSAIARAELKRVDDPNASYIDETGVIPADPDGYCARYIVAVNKAGLRSFGQPVTYGCMRTPPVTPAAPRVEIVDNKIIRITVDQGDNDPATGVGVYEAEHDSWVSPEHLFQANSIYPTFGEWNANDGILLIGLRPNTGYTFFLQARSVTGEVSKFAAPVHVRMPAEAADLGAPKLDRIGEQGNLRNEPLTQTFVTKQRAPAIAGLVSAGSLVTIDLDDRPFQATVAPAVGSLASFVFRPSKLAKGLHTLRLGAVSGGATAWTPTIEFRIK